MIGRPPHDLDFCCVLSTAESRANIWPADYIYIFKPQVVSAAVRSN